jgi:hypothetical protein
MIETLDNREAARDPAGKTGHAPSDDPLAHGLFVSGLQSG